MKIPISGFTFPSEEQKSAKNISESISFPDDLVKTEDGGSERQLILFHDLTQHV
jgi:hypothetical protein